MPQHTYLSVEEDRLSFVRRAVLNFKENPHYRTYTDSANQIRPGEYLAIRWGAADDCVLLLKLDEYFEPVIYGQVIPPKEDDA